MNKLDTVRGVTDSDGLRLEAPLVHQETAARSGPGRQTAPASNHWIRVDRSWAKRLGLRRDGGVYRIRSKDLVLRLGPLAEGGSSNGHTPKDQWSKDATRRRRDTEQDRLDRRGHGQGPDADSPPAAA